MTGLIRGARHSWLGRTFVEPTLEAVTDWLRRKSRRILDGAIEAVEANLGPVGTGVLAGVALGVGTILAPKAMLGLIGSAAIALGLRLGKRVLDDLCRDCWEEHAESEHCALDSALCALCKMSYRERTESAQRLPPVPPPAPPLTPWPSYDPLGPPPLTRFDSWGRLRVPWYMDDGVSY